MIFSPDVFIVMYTVYDDINHGAGLDLYTIDVEGSVGLSADEGDGRVQPQSLLDAQHGVRDLVQVIPGEKTYISLMKQFYFVSLYHSNL